MTRVKKHKRCAHDAGFTLIELSIVLIIIGIVLALGIGLIGPMLKDANVAKAKETIDGTMESIQGFVASNKRVPCEVNDNTGTCASAPDEFTPILKTPTDPWGNPLNYIYDHNLTNTATGGDICGRRSTQLTVRQCLDATCVGTAGINYNDIQNVAYIVWSFGPNSANQMVSAYPGVAGDVESTQNLPLAMTMTLYIAPLGTLNIPTGNNLEYDDVVKWVTIDELRVKAGCEGSPVKILNNELPPATVSNPYTTVTIYPSGGVPSGGNYRWCVQTASNIFSAAGGLTINGSASPAFVVADCSIGTWSATPTLAIGGTPLTTADKTSNLIFFIRDYDTPANQTQKALVLTINP